jgi:hypothetical protein
MKNTLTLQDQQGMLSKAKIIAAIKFLNNFGAFAK